MSTINDKIDLPRIIRVAKIKQRCFSSFVLIMQYRLCNTITLKTKEIENHSSHHCIDDTFWSKLPFSS